MHLNLVADNLIKGFHYLSMFLKPKFNDVDFFLCETQYKIMLQHGCFFPVDTFCSYAAAMVISVLIDYAFTCNHISQDICSFKSMARHYYI